MRVNTWWDRAKGYGMSGTRIDGNNILEVIDTVSRARTQCISEGKPYLIECDTFRMRGHEEASGVKYVPDKLFEEWGKKDPVLQFEIFLVKEGALDGDKKEELYNEIKKQIENELSLSNNDPIQTDTAKEIHDVYAVSSSGYRRPTVRVIDNSLPSITNYQPSTEKRFVDAIKEGLYQSMLQHSNLVLMGQDIAEYGGAFKITEGFVQAFGKARVRNTPICESAIVGAALGLSLEGYKSVVEMQFADFVTVGFNQIVNNLAKINYRWGQNADVVIRMPTGAGVGAGPFHSQSNEAWFVHTPGLKVVYPSSPLDAKGLLIAAINDPNPVLFFEHKAMYRSVEGEVPGEYYEVEIGKARIVKQGSDVSIITYGMGVHWALTCAEKHPSVSFDILDLRTLLPLDYEAIKASVQRTGKVLILHEDTLTGGLGGELSAWINEYCFLMLDAPVVRCASLDTPIPFNVELEKNFLAKSRLNEVVEGLIKY